jgi:phosphate transport system permease protein
MDAVFQTICYGSALFAVLLLGLLIFRIVSDGLPRLNLEFIRSALSSRPKRTGMWPAIQGSIVVMALTAIIAVPVGVLAAIYLEEFTPRRNPLASFIQLNIANLAGVPSIVYGLLGLAVFVRGFGFGSTVLAGSLTMALLILPMIIIVTQEALRSVPGSLREASLGLGSTRWQAIRHQVLPSAAPGIMTGVILAIGRALGETAPLIVVGAVAGVVDGPTSIKDRYTVLPMQIFTWSSDARAEAHSVAATGILILMAVLLLLNSVAIYMRGRSMNR